MHHPLLAAASLALLFAGPSHAGDDFPAFKDVSKDYTKVTTGVDSSSALYTLYRKDAGADILAELPKSFEKQRLFIHSVVSKGSPLAGVGLLMSQERYVRWERNGKQLVLIMPELGVRNTDKSGAGKLSHEAMYTDRVLLSVPIVTMGPGGGPVIDLDSLLLGRASMFFGPSTIGARVPLAKIAKAKAFPNNIEVAFEVPLGDNPPGFSMFGEEIGGASNSGRITELHASISVLPENTGYKPRLADPRVGFFTTSFNDMAKTTKSSDPWTRYITRWHVEKADASLRLSPPKQPIVWYIEHTVPIRYRRHVRDGLLQWNKAFEKVGIVDAIEVRQQDATSGAYMDLDPEDIRYSFVRWNNNQAPFAIGPSSADPTTGQIFQADLTINTGVFASMTSQLKAVMPSLATEGFSAETMAWLDENPQWDPRVRLADPSQRGRLIAEATARRAAGVVPPSGFVADPNAVTGTSRELECLAGLYSAFGTGLVQLAAEEETDSDTALIDGVPEDYAVAMLRWLTSHESGHCLGLAHNFMASTIHSLESINSPDFPADVATGGSVMEYPAPNINVDNGEVQGQWTIQNIGPYDYWAIEYGYTLDDDLAPVLAKVSDPHHVYGTNVDGVGADPRVRTYDFGADPLNFAESRLRLVNQLRGKILEDFVAEGEGWGEARRAYQSLLNQHVQAVSIAAGWVGGSYIVKDFKGDPGNRRPIENIPADVQRRALGIVIDNTFPDDAYGLTTDLLHAMNIDRWGDGGDSLNSTDPAYSSHDMVRGVQTAAISMVMNPTTLRRVYDNEFRVPAGDDALSLAELLDSIVAASFSELIEGSLSGSDIRRPAISSLRRNLQADVVDRLISLSLNDSLNGATARPIASLSRHVLRQTMKLIDERNNSRLDIYTRSHLSDMSERISSALAAGYNR